MKKLLLISSLIASSLLADGYNETANKISKDLIKTLGGQLKANMKQGGPVQAVEFCSQNAYNLTKQVSDKYKGIEVKRISLNPRNPANTASEDEATILKSMQTMYKVGVKPRNIIQEKDGKVVVYKPLVIKKQVCLKCHGDIAKNPKVAKKIASIYPNDKAVGQKMGDLRGAIVVTMPKKDKK
jgi:hypothetical protein